nr:winged helix-turn-helix domain-containing protein [Spirochaetota bacterium]
INLLEYSIYYDNEKLDFTYKEFELLRLLVQNSGQAFSRKDLLAKIWGVEYIGGTRTVDVHIRRLRSKLGDDFNSLIETVRNVGYRCIK